MVSTSSLRILARYNILTPATALGIGMIALAGSAFAQDITNSSPSAAQHINAGFGFTNNSSIHALSGDALSNATSDSAVTFITNASAGSIVADEGRGVAVVGTDSSIGTFVNNGLIQGSEQGVYAEGSVGSFTNTNTVYGGDGVAVEILGDVTTFLNSGTIHSSYNNGVDVNGVGTFTNNGDIVGNDTGVYAEGAVGTFVNTKTITGLDDNAVYFDDHVDSFSNSGTITSYNRDGVGFDNGAGTIVNSGIVTAQSDGFSIFGDVDSFSNDATGTIHGVADGVVVGDCSCDSTTVTSFLNAGMISSDEGYGVVFYGKGTYGAFKNSGQIKSHEAGVAVLSEAEAVGAFTNTATGVIHGDQFGVVIDPESAVTVGDFTNNGTIEGIKGPGLIIGGGYLEEGFDPEFAVASVGAVTNTGSITGRFFGAIIDSESAVSIANSGTIAAIDVTPYDAPSIGLAFDHGDLVNSGSGLIKGGSGVVIFNQSGSSYESSVTNSGSIIGTNGPGVSFAGIGDPTVTNSGLISGSNGIAVDFGATVGDNLILQTGGKFIGAVAYGVGPNTLDFSGYRGNILLTYTGGDPTLTAGPGLYAQSGKSIAIMDDTAIRDAAQPVEDLVKGVQGSISDALDGTGGTDNSASFVNGYAASAKSTPAAAAASDMLTPASLSGATGWGSLIGGGDINNTGSRSSTIYGGLVGGAQAELSAGFTLGALGGYGHTSFQVVNGPQTVTSDTGIIGVYGKTNVDLVALEFSVLAGFGANHSARTVSTGAGDETASGNFGSWFIAPQIAASIPIMTMANGEIGITGRAGYIAGGFSGYTETGSTADAVVAAETIGIFDSSIEINGSTVLKSTDAGDVKLTGKAGLFAQINVGGSTSVPVTLLGVPTAGSAASGASGFGVYGGLGIDDPISSNLMLRASFDGSARTDGTVGGAARVKLSGDF